MPAWGETGALLGLAKWNLGSWMLLWYGLTFGLATVTWTRPQPSPANQIAISSVLRALWLVAFGITFWAIGYCIGPGHLVRRLASKGLATLGKKRPWQYGVSLHHGSCTPLA